MSVSRRKYLEQLVFTKHAIARMNARRISRQAVTAAIQFGRVVYFRGAKYFVLGHKEVQRYASLDTNLTRYAGLQVVCVENRILTVYRNHDFSGLRKGNRPWSR